MRFAWPLLLAASIVAGCASSPVNPPIDRVDPKAGYRAALLIHDLPDNDPHTFFVLAFSGGGTRAAAFSFGVLEEFRRTEVVVDGQRRRLLDEVDVITGVSGGSFTAVAYALHGERLFDEYGERFLKRDVQGALLWRAHNPLYGHKYIGGSAGRSSTTVCSGDRREWTPAVLTAYPAARRGCTDGDLHGQPPKDPAHALRLDVGRIGRPG